MSVYHTPPTRVNVDKVLRFVIYLYVTERELPFECKMNGESRKIFQNKFQDPLEKKYQRTCIVRFVLYASKQT